MPHGITTPGAPNPRKKETYEYDFGIRSYPTAAQVRGGKYKATKKKSSADKEQQTSGVVNAFGQSFDMSDPKQKAAYEKLQKQELERQRKRGGGFSDIRGGDGLRPDGSRIIPQTTRAIPTGGVQKGTDMSGANTLLRTMGIDTVQYGQFESNHLPGEQKTAGKPQKTNTDAVMGGETPETATSHSAGWTVDANNENFSTKETKLVESGVIPASNLAELGTRARYSQEFMADRPNMRDIDNESLVGLRAADASKGLLYASGQYWQENSDGGFDKIDKATYKRIKRGNKHALDFARDKIEDAKSIIKQGDNKNYDTDGFSVEDAEYMGMTPTQARAQGSGGSVETLIGGSYEPDTSSLTPEVRQAVELTSEPFSVMNSSEEKLREQLRAIKKR